MPESTFEDFLLQRLRARLCDHRLLTMYDPERRYLEVVRQLGGGDTTIIEVTDDLISTREDALDKWRALASDSKSQSSLVIHINRARPLEELAQQQDPFTVFVVAGAVFPDGERDTFPSLCQQFLPEQADAIDELFKESEPTIAMINGLAAGDEKFPVLAAVLGGDGPKAVLLKFLSPEGNEDAKLEAAPHWREELGALLERLFAPGLNLHHGDVHDIRRRLWTFLLFSEFAQDLPGELPPALQHVPKAPAKKAPVVHEFCSILRDRRTTQPLYEEQANAVASALALENHCRGIEDLGRLDTFAFEERSFLRRFAKALLKKDLETSAGILAERVHTFWLRDAVRAAEWRLAGCCHALFSKLADVQAAMKQNPNRSLADWVGFYSVEAWRLDRFHREMEQVAQQLAGVESPLVEVLTLARADYRRLSDQLARKFQDAVAVEGWPAPGQLRATDIFERCVKPRWQQGKRVAFFWVDALRYELGRSLENLLATRHGLSVEVACAQLPTVTRVGMAALLPGAESDLKLGISKGDLAVTVKGRPVENPTNRFELVREFVGQDRSRLVDLDHLTSAKFKDDFEGVEVLVVKSTDIDSVGENTPEFVMTLAPEVLRKLQIAVNRLADCGFDYAVIAADHGFLWFEDASAGDAIARPPGEWIQVKNRSLLGAGQPEGMVLLMDTKHVGIRTDIQSYVAARGLATFLKGVRYFHEGLSLPECVLPVVTVELRVSRAERAATPVEIVLTYRGAGSGVITTLRPSVEMSYPAADLFGPEEVRVVLEAYALKNGQKVADAAAHPSVDPGTQEVTIALGQSLKVPLRMKEGFEGEFEVRAISRATNETFATLKLKTDYHH